MPKEEIRKDNLSPEQIVDLDKQRQEAFEKFEINEKNVLDKAREDLNQWQAYFSENITRGKDDMNFLLRDQWTARERSEFNRLQKVIFTFNKLYDSVKKIAGEQRKNKPDLIVRSLTGKASEEEIELRAELVRSISYQSQNDLIYQSAFKSALIMGYGAFQIGIEYENPKSFYEVIRYQMIPDATRTAFDPTALKPHKGDGNFCSRTYLLTKKEFDATYPYIKNPVSFVDPRNLLDYQWQQKDTIVVCEYFVKEWYPTLIYLLSNGLSVTESEWKLMQKNFEKQREMAKDSQVLGDLILNEIPKIIYERKTQDYRIMHYRLLKDEIIEFSEWPSKYLPIIFVDGDSHFIEGRQYTRSFVKEAKDAQRFVNYLGSEIATDIKNRRRERWIATKENIVGNEFMWKNPEVQMGAMIAQPDPKTGMMPQQLPAWELSGSLLDQYLRGSSDIKEILGFFEENRGEASNAISGVAIANRQYAGSMSAYIFFDNLNQAIEQSGRVVLDLLPVVYGQDNRFLVVSRKDGTSKPVVLNQRNEDGSVTNIVNYGDFDIEIDTGPSFALQKQAALELFQQTIAANPQTFNLIADLWAKNLDIQFMPQIAERFKSLVPPEILAKEAGEPPPPPPPPTAEEQFVQAQQQVAVQELQTRAADLQLKKQKFDQDFELGNQKLDLEKAQIMLKAQEMGEKLDLEKEGKNIEAQKTDLDYSAKIAKILADLQKGR